MTLKFKDISKFQGTSFLNDAYDGYILNCTPQNVYRDQQVETILGAGKLIGYYNWPLAYSNTWQDDARLCAAWVNGKIAQNPAARGPVAIDIESGSYPPGDVVAGVKAWCDELESHNLGSMLYLQYSLLNYWNWAPVANRPLWFAEYTSAPDQTFGPWSFATMWQDSDSAPGGGDDDILYTDQKGWAALSRSTGVVLDKPSPAPVQRPAQPSVVGQATVTAGDSLSSIANQVGVTLAAIEAVNPQIPNFNVINVGEVINLPQGANLSALSGAPAARPAECIVEAGDTLSGIANQFGTTVDGILRMNPWITDPDVIQVGWVLHLPQ